MTAAASSPSPWTLRTSLRPGDLGEVVRLHGVVYAAEHGFDHTFEAYVAEPLARFARARSPRERLWLADRDGALAGCVAIVAAPASGSATASGGQAQLRWFLVAPEARGTGLGRRLLAEAVAFSWDRGYRSITLWTTSQLTTAARLYRAAGFALVERKPGRQWGVDVVEERYELVRPD